MAIAVSAAATCSPVAASTSISRAAGTASIWWARPRSRLVSPLIALTMTTTSLPAFCAASERRATLRIRSIVPTEVPPYFCTRSATICRLRDQRSHVVVIGSEAKQKLFSGLFPIGKTLRLNGISFQIIGVMAPHMQEGDDNVNRTLMIPDSTMGDLKDPKYLDGIWFTYNGD